MSTTTPASRRATPPGTTPNPNAPRPLGALDILFLAAAGGLTGGLAEVGTRVLCRAINPTRRLYLMSRHFVWLTPLVNLFLFACLGLCLALIVRFWPRLGAWLSFRLVCALAILPIFIVATPQIYPEASLVLALGMASLIVPMLPSEPSRLRRRLLGLLPALLGVVMILAGGVFGGQWLKERREHRRALPPAGSPNVLFIVLDTVRFDRLSLYGYQRSTTPTLERFSKRGIRFDAARASAPWTLASHASFFSGRWPHELKVEWETPLVTNAPMLAEYLGARGYATSGFVGNVGYCSYDTGLDRGFTHYEDYVLERLAPLRMAAIFEEVRKSLLAMLLAAVRRDAAALHDVKETAATWFGTELRRAGESVGAGFLNWLDHRRDPRRPFFVFLNYCDAHSPYRLPPSATPRFSRKPQTPDELAVICDDWTFIDKSRLPPYYLRLARDSYDNCIAHVDEMLGQLSGELERRRLLETTWIVITSDHGEGFGEHGLFEHGESLYSTEIHVPLLIVPPMGGPHQEERVVRDTVSLRDLPATVVEMVGLATGAPFPGSSLMRLWDSSEPRAHEDTSRAVFAELRTPSPVDSSHGQSPARRGPLISLADGNFLYILNEGDHIEELYNERDDPRELINLTSRNAPLPELERFRKMLARFKASTGAAGH